MGKKDIFISHRGNLWGPDLGRENKKNSIIECINFGYDVEIDVWSIKNKLYLGHDTAQEKIDLNFLKKHHKKLWVHCKNLEALHLLSGEKINYFWHQNDDYTLTSKNYIWTYPNKKITPKCVIVCQTLKETKKYSKQKPFKICTDFLIENQD